MLEKNYFKFNELVDNWGISANDVHYLIQQNKLKPSIVWHNLYYQVELIDTSFDSDFSSFIESHEKDINDNYIYSDGTGKEVFDLTNPKYNGPYKYIFEYAICPDKPEDHIYFKFSKNYGYAESFDEKYIEESAFFCRDTVDTCYKKFIKEDNKPKTTSSNNKNRSDMLSYLNQASDIFWGNANPKEPDSHPKNIDIEDWLIKNGYSPSLAKKAASIIRPEWASKGRPKEY